MVDLLAGQECCLTAQEVFDGLRSARRPVGIASVYRSLDLLVELGLVQRLEMGSGVAYFEAIDASGEHHHHFVCRRCGAVLPFTDEPLELALVRLVDRLRLDLEGHEVVLRGTCRACAVGS